MSTVDGVERDRFIRWLLDLAPSYEWTAWQGLDRVKADLAARALVGTYERAMTSAGSRIVLERDGDAPTAGAILTPKPMESEHFGVPTVSVAHPVARSDVRQRPRIVRQLLDRVVEEAPEAQLFMLRVHAGDVEMLAAAQDSGFRVVEGTLTYLADCADQDTATNLHDGLVVDVFEGGSGDHMLSASEIDTLSRATSSWNLSRFRADPHLDQRAVDNYYRSWIPNIVSGQFSDCVYVARFDGELVGIYAECTDPDLLDLTGTTVRVGSWMVVLQPGLGAGRALMRTSAAHRYPGGRFHENETQIHNVGAIRSFDHMTFIRSGYTLHAWPRR